MSHFADSDLISRTLLHKDHNAYGELIRRHSSAVRSLLRKLTGGDWALADDLAQDTFIQGYRKLAGFRGEAGFSTWLYRIATNLFLSHCRKVKRRGEISGDLEDRGAAGSPGAVMSSQRSRGHGSGPSASDVSAESTSLSVKDWSADQRQALHLDMEKALRTLNERERAVVSLTYFAGCSHSQAADILGCPVGTVKTLIMRAKEKLRPKLAVWKERKSLV